MTNFYDSDSSDGTGQPERFPAALRHGYFLVDEMGPEQLLVLSKRLAGNLKYYNLQDKWVGEATWEDLFAEDPVFVLADIANTNTEKLELEYRTVASRQSISARADVIYSLAANIDRWHLVLSTSSQQQFEPICIEVKQIVHNSLAKGMAGIQQLLHDEPDEFSADAQSREANLSAIWGSGATDRTVFASAAAKLRYLDENFHRFVGAINYLKAIAGNGLDKSMANGEQNPAMSLFIAFLKLYSRAQEKINEFPDKRLEFYYSRLLGAAPQLRRPEKVNLALTLAPGQPAAIVPGGTQFLAGKDDAGRDIVFASDQDLLLTNATVGKLRTFFLAKDPLISPHDELDCITRIVANELDANISPAIGYPLFGADTAATGQARVGLAIASPLLHLGEGQRKITIDIECRNARPDRGSEEELLPEDSAQAAAELAGVAEKVRDGTAQRAHYSHRLGQVFARELLSSSAWLSDRDKDTILQASASVFGENCESNELLKMERTALFYHLLRDALYVRLSTEAGWSQRNDYIITLLPAHRDGSVAGLRLELGLSPDDPAVVAYDTGVHGGNFSTDQPVASLRMNPNSMFYAYSLFAALEIRTINLKVAVSGARALLAYSHLGQLDPAKPFQPFGPQPSRDSYLAIGHYEAALKPLSEVYLNISWGGLPLDFGGFEEYYSGYQTKFSSNSFQVQTSSLAHSGWADSNSEAQPLFKQVEATGQVSQDCRLDLLGGGHFTTLETGLAESEYRLDNLSHAGFFRIDLRPSESAFGHAEYPALLTSVLMANAKRRKPIALPQQPYTPMICKLSLDYSAQTNISIRTEGASHAAVTESKLFHEYPFGTIELARAGREGPLTLMPKFQHDGYLFIGLSSDGPPGMLSLLFELQGGVRRVDDQPIQCDWFYLSDNQLVALKKHTVLRDTTAGFTRSGIVTIEVPDDIDASNTVLQSGFYWIAIGALGDLALCPRLNSVMTGALRAVRQINDEDTRFAPLAGSVISEAISAPASIGKIEQPGASFGGRATEDRERLITRTAERLHHKNRACQPWDYERMALEHFPDLYKVKCFANMRVGHQQAMPGEVMIVVVPRFTRAATAQAQHLLVNPDRLEEIRRYLAGKTSAFANISVRNPAYELIQIRCSVKLAESVRFGKYTRELQQLISDFISPWRPQGYGANFGWRIRRKDIESFINAARNVEFVTDFSMLHITKKNDGSYSLQDTARPQGTPNEDSIVEKPVGQLIDEIRPRYPWSLALPSRQHYIELISDLNDRPAQPTGVDELEIGSTLILDGGNGFG